MRLVSAIGRAWALTYVTLGIVLLGALGLAALIALMTSVGPFDGWFAVGVLGDANQTARHEPLEGILHGHVCGVRSTEA